MGKDDKKEPKKRASSTAAGSAKGSKKKKVESVDETADEAGTETADKGAIQNIINTLKYRADPTKNKKGKDMEESAKLLDHYRNIKGSEDRALFVQRFQQLGIVKFADKLGLLDKTEDYDDKKEAVNVNYKNWRYIFKAEGLDPKDYTADEEEGGELDQMLHKLLVRNAKEHGYEKGMKPGDEEETDRDLVRWLYVDNKGTDYAKGTKNSLSFSKKGEGDVTKGAEEKALADMKKAGVEIKIEYQKWMKMQQRLNVIKSGKGKMVTLKNKIDEIKVGLKVKAQKDKAYQSKVDQTQDTLDKITTFVDETTEDILTWSAVTKEDSIEDTVFELMDDKIKNIDNFCTALQEFKKDMNKAL